MTLTTVIITKNEEKDLGRTLDSLKFADETLVVDSNSTDNTREIAKRAGARVIVHQFKSYADQRNFADSQVNSDWVLSLDADVIVTQKLALEIIKAINNKNISAYRIGRINIIWGKPILVADWSPRDDNHIWLYKNGVGRWDSAVHEEYVTSAKTGQLTNNLIHYNYNTVSEYIEKINSYSEIEAGKNSGVNWLSPLVDFGKRYFYKLGFTAGYRGLFLSYLQAIYFVTLRVKLWQKRYT